MLELTNLIDLSDFKGQLTSKQMMQLIDQTNYSESEICLKLLSLASNFAIAPISKFNVGAIVKGHSGTFYFGANIEFPNTHLGQTIHAEQSAIAHAWAFGETALSALYVNYSPCGHCRQFINELNNVSNLIIQLPERPPLTINEYLPDPFGPESLQSNDRLLQNKVKKLTLKTPNIPISLENNPKEEKLITLALKAASESYAPYSKGYSGVSIELDNGATFIGRYAENAAFNPSLLPLQSALILMQMQGFKEFSRIKKVILVETTSSEVIDHKISHRSTTNSLLLELNPLALFYFYEAFT